MDARQLLPAHEILDAGAKALRERAATRDTPAGERSMGLAVRTFNALKGTRLSERDGWQFMEILKMARAEQGGFNADDYIDGAAYAALAGECAAEEFGREQESSRTQKEAANDR